MGMPAQTYEQITFSDSNPIKRWLQKGRLTYAVAIAESLPPPNVIMDFGAGNGRLCRLLASRYPHARIICYEPSDDLMAEAKANLADVKGIEFLSDLEIVENGAVDLVF